MLKRLSIALVALVIVFSFLVLGLRVYASSQGHLPGPPKEGNWEKIRSTGINMIGYENGSVLRLNITNDGVRKINISNFDIYYKPTTPERPVSNYSDLPEEWKKGEEKCLVNGGNLETNETISCSTGVKFPGALEGIRISIEGQSFDYETSKECAADSSNQTICMRP